MRYLHQTPEEIIKAADPATRVLWEELLLLFGERFSLCQHYFYGAIAGSEFLTYRARRVWLALQFGFGWTGNPTAANFGLSFYNEANVLSMVYNNSVTTFDSVAAQNEQVGNSFIVPNIYFGRIIAATYTYCHFVGYRITY